MIAFVRRHPVTFVFLLGLLLLLPGVGTLPLIDRDEPRFATATVEMIRRHDWVVPWFNGEHRFDKPALVYWLMRAGYALLGVGEAGARLHTVVAGALLAAWLFDTGRKWFSEKAGAVAAVGFLVCVQVQIHGRLCLADMPMVLCVAVVCRSLFELLHPEAGDESGAWKKRLLLWLAAGVGFLAKGPVVFVVPAFALIVHRFVFFKKPLPWSRLGAAWGAPLSLAVVAPWGLLALIRTQGEFWKIGMGKHVIERGSDVMVGGKAGPLFYLGTIFLSLCPAVAYAPRFFFTKPAGDPKRAWLLAWFYAPLVIFSVYATKLPHYILPGFPAFFLLLGAWLAKPESERGASGLRIQKILFSVYAALALLGGAFGLSLWSGIATVPGPYAAGLRDFGAAAFHLAGCIAGAWLVTLGLSRTNPMRWAFPGVLMLAASFAGFSFYFRKTSPAVALRSVMSDPTIPADARFIGTSEYREGSLVFYAGRVWKFIDDPERLREEIAKPGPAALVVIDERVRNESLLAASFAGIVGLDAPLKIENFSEKNRGLTDGFSERGKFSGFSPGNGKWVTVRFLVRE